MNTALAHFLKYQNSFDNSEYLFDFLLETTKIEIDNFTLIDRPKPSKQVLKVLNKKFYNLREGRLFTLVGENNPTSTYLTITKVIDRDKYLFEHSEIKFKDPSIPTKLLQWTDEFTATPEMLPTIKNKIKTTIGRYFVNKYALFDHFGDIFPYINDVTFNFDYYEKQICELALEDKITVEQIVSYQDALVFCNHLVSYFVPNLTEGLLTPSTKVEKLRKELYKKYEGRLDDPKVMVQIEDTLIAADKEDLKDDPSKFFVGGKTFNTARRRMFYNFGVVEPFDGDPSKYKFVKSNLDSGWDHDDTEFTYMLNEVRKGIHSRAIGTGKGGVITKDLGRAFQSAAIIEDDCGSKEGLRVRLEDWNKNEYKYRYIIDKGKIVLLTSKNLDKNVGKTITLRSPAFCKTNGGYCFTCMGFKYKKLNITRLVGEPLEIGSMFLYASMQAMHGTKATLVDISNFVMYIE